ncbi:hypothetical protein [Aquimarina rhabdastrellae]
MDYKNKALNKEDFTREIIESLNIDFQTFIEGVIDNKPYDALLFYWIDKLYQKGTSIERSLKIIYRVRRFYYLQPYRIKFKNSVKLDDFLTGFKKRKESKEKVLIPS